MNIELTVIAETNKDALRIMEVLVALSRHFMVDSTATTEVLINIDRINSSSPEMTCLRRRSKTEAALPFAFAEAGATFTIISTDSLPVTVEGQV